MVANFVSTIAAAGSTSAFTINDVLKAPAALLCTTPAVLNPLIVTVPVADIFMRSAPLVSNDNWLAVAHDNPVPVLTPVKLIDGAAAVPAEAVKFAEIVPALKFPEPSRATIAFAVFALVAVVAELETLPAVLMVANFVSTIAAAGSTSAFTINDVLKAPAALLCTTPAVLNPLIVTVPVADIFMRSAPLVSNDN